MNFNKYMSSFCLLILTVILTVTKAGKPLKPGQCEGKNKGMRMVEIVGIHS